MVRAFGRGSEGALALVAIVLAASVGIAALGSAIGLPPLPEPLAELDQRLPVIFKMHMVASGLGLILLPPILLLRHRPSLHRVLGRLGAGLLLVGAATSLPSALLSEATPVARLGFLAQGVLCLVFLVGGVRAIWRRDFQRHAQLMMQLSALVFGAIILRALMAVAMSLGWSFDATYAALAWLSWVVPLATVMLWPNYVSSLREARGGAPAGGGGVRSLSRSVGPCSCGQRPRRSFRRRCPSAIDRYHSKISMTSILAARVFLLTPPPPAGAPPRASRREENMM